MTLRKRIILSNICMVVVPILFTLTIWTIYVYFNDGSWVKPINRASKTEDFVGTTQNILYLFEAELSDMNWEVVMLPDKGRTDIILYPEQEKVEELSELGFHLRVESGDTILFSNMDEFDIALLERAGVGETRTDGALYWIEDSMVIKDSFHLDERICTLTAIYNETKADAGIRSSMIPMYMVSPVMGILFLCIAVCSITFMAFILTKWLNHSVVEPLEALKTCADRITENDFDYRIGYYENDEFGDVCREFEQMRKALKNAHEDRERYEEERRELLRGVSHDLRSPLTSIRGYAEGLLDGMADSEEKKERYCRAILTRAGDMQRLTDNLSAFVHLDSGEFVLHKHRTNLAVYLKDFLEKNMLFLEQNNIHVSYQAEVDDIEINLDVSQMDRVFANLLENTVKYRNKNESVVLLCLQGTIDGEMAEIEFLDDGPGIKTRQLAHIFDSFYRGSEARTKPENGSGLGLAVVKSIIQRHGGKVEAFMRTGLGIRIYLPVDKKENKNDEKNFNC